MDLDALSKNPTPLYPGITGILILSLLLLFQVDLRNERWQILITALSAYSLWAVFIGSIQIMMYNRNNKEHISNKSFWLVMFGQAALLVVLVLYLWDRSVI